MFSVFTESELGNPKAKYVYHPFPLLNMKLCVVLLVLMGNL